VEAAAIVGAGSGVSVLLVGWFEVVVLGSGRERDLPQAGERSGQRECPGPVLGQAQEDLCWPRVMRAAVCSSR